MLQRNSSNHLLIGIMFGNIYCVLETITPASFHGQGDLAAKIHESDWGFFQLSYFSLMTLTTVGYGDITPANQSARSLAAAEAILGHFYLAVLIAELIGKKVAQAITEARE